MEARSAEKNNTEEGRGGRGLHPGLGLLLLRPPKFCIHSKDAHTMQFYNDKGIKVLPAIYFFYPLSDYDLSPMNKEK